MQPVGVFFLRGADGGRGSSLPGEGVEQAITMF